MLTLLIGGARSGKSALAVEMGLRAERDGLDVTYIATAPAPAPGTDDDTGTDDDMSARIERHRDERPATWGTIEEQTDLAGALEAAPDGLVIIDCLTLWTSNLMWANGQTTPSDDDMRALGATVAAACAARRDRVVAITNEVGLGIHPETELGRRYRDVLGWVNQSFAAVADPTLLLVAGRALTLHDPFTHLA